jgi:hypothetical protein
VISLFPSELENRVLRFDKFESWMKIVHERNAWIVQGSADDAIDPKGALYAHTDDGRIGVWMPEDDHNPGEGLLFKSAKEMAH